VKQNGVTLMELLIAMAISLVVVAAMVALMANTLETGTRTIEMSRLTQEMRTTFQLMTRDVRRANYSAEAILCFGNVDCATDGTASPGDDVTIDADNDCFYFQVDRDHDGDVTNDIYGGFKLGSVSGVGTLEIWMDDDDTTPNCSSTSSSRCDLGEWCPITDPNVVDVTDFQVRNSYFGYTDVILDDGDGNQTLSKVRKIYLHMEAELVGNSDVSRVIEDVIRIRNDVIILP
jgi:prepilin-type N-terminal cleavage/methylation domain-containing protein